MQIILFVYNYSSFHYGKVLHGILFFSCTSKHELWLQWALSGWLLAKKIQSVFVMAKAVVSLADPEVFCSCNVILYPVIVNCNRTCVYFHYIRLCEEQGVF